MGRVAWLLSLVVGLCSSIYGTASAQSKTEASSEPIIVAVIDDGFRPSHEVFKGMLWRNPNEIENNGIDDDGNGYIDDVNGWDISDQDETITPPKSRLVEYYHGTHMAGLIAQTIREYLGEMQDYPIKIMLIKAVSDHAQQLYIKDGYRAMQYALDQGADIINASWSGGVLDADSVAVLSVARKQNTFIAASVGTFPQQQASNPGAHPAVFGVGGIDENYQLAAISNYGDEVDLVANAMNARAADVLQDDQYRLDSGVSVSVARVSATAALMKHVNPGITKRALEYCLKSTADPVDSFNLKFAGKLGAGALNMKAAIDCAKQPNNNSRMVEFAQPEGSLIFTHTPGLTTDPVSWRIRPIGEYDGQFISQFVEGIAENSTLSLYVYNDAGNKALIWNGLLADSPPSFDLDSASFEIVIQPNSSKHFYFGANYHARAIDFSRRYCDGKVIIEGDAEFEDGSGANHYASHSNCKWLLKPTKNNNVKIEFLQLNTEPNVDFVYLFRGDNTRQQNYLMQVSGNESPPNIIVERDPVLLWFVSDDKNEAGGFKVRVTMVQENQ